MSNGTLLKAVTAVLLSPLLMLGPGARASTQASAEMSEATITEIAAQPLTHNEVYATAPVPTEDALWDRYAAEVFRRASNPPQDLFGWHPALLDEQTLASWTDLAADPRFWELYHFCLYGQAQYYYYELRLLREIEEAEQSAIDSERERAYALRLQPWELNPQLLEEVESGGQDNKDESGKAERPRYADYAGIDIATLAGSSLMPLKVLRERGEASLTAVLRLQELNSMLDSISASENLQHAAIGRWPGGDYGYAGGLTINVAPATGALEVSKLIEQFPNNAWPHYAAAQMLLGLRQDEAALAELRLGNAAPIYELPYLYPHSTVAGRLDAFTDLGNLAVAGLVLDASCTDTAPAMFAQNWGVGDFAYHVVNSGDAQQMQDLHVFALRLAGLRRSDPRYLFGASQILQSLSGAWLHNAPEGLDEQSAGLLETSTKGLGLGLLWEDPGNAFGSMPSEILSLPAGYDDYCSRGQPASLGRIWRTYEGRLPGISSSEWFYEYLWLEPNYGEFRWAWQADPHEAVASWAASGLANEWLSAFNHESAASRLARLARLDYRKLPPHPVWTDDGFKAAGS